MKSLLFEGIKIKSFATVNVLSELRSHPVPFADTFYSTVLWLRNTDLKHVAKESCAPLHPDMGYAVNSIQFPNLFKPQFASDFWQK